MPQGATISVSGHPFDETLAFFTDELGFRLDRISPADNPTMAVVSGGGLSLLLDPDIAESTAVVYLETGAAPTSLHLMVSKFGSWTQRSTPS